MLPENTMNLNVIFFTPTVISAVSSVQGFAATILSELLNMA